MAFLTGQVAKEQRERRASPRRRVSIRSWVIGLDGALALMCQTQDASPEGARILLAEQVTLPQTLFYLDGKDRIAYEAQVRWQNKTEAGLQFLKAFRFSEVRSEAVRKALKELGG